MKRTVMAVLCAAFLAFSTTGCYTLNHTVNGGAKGHQTTAARQWYALWGLIPINSVDGGKMAGGAASYSIKSQMSVVDFLINIVTGMVTVYSRTVEVTK